MSPMTVNPGRLREAREVAGVSQRDAAAHVDVTERSLRAWEKGESRISANQAATLARFYGVQDLWSLFIHAPEGATPSDGDGKPHEPDTAAVGGSAGLAHDGG
jgi:transcriptional regulator with XRE-family HTH domain